MMITTSQNAATNHTGAVTNHHDQVMTLHHFRVARMAVMSSGHNILNRILLRMVGSVGLVERAGFEPALKKTMIGRAAIRTLYHTLPVVAHVRTAPTTSTLRCCALLSELMGKPFVRDRVCCGVYFATGNHADKGHDGREAWSRMVAACTLQQQHKWPWAAILLPADHRKLPPGGRLRKFLKERFSICWH